MDEAPHTTPEVILNRLRNTVHDKLDDSIDFIEEKLIKDKRFRGKDALVVKGIRALARALSDSLNKEQDIFEIFVERNIFHIDKEMRAKDDKTPDFEIEILQPEGESPPKEDLNVKQEEKSVEGLKFEEIDELLKEIIRQQTFNLYVQRQIEQMESDIQVFDETISSLGDKILDMSSLQEMCQNRDILFKNVVKTEKALEKQGLQLGGEKQEAQQLIKGNVSVPEELIEHFSKNGNVEQLQYGFSSTDVNKQT